MFAVYRQIAALLILLGTLGAVRDILFTPPEHWGAPARFVAGLVHITTPTAVGGLIREARPTRRP